MKSSKQIQKGANSSSGSWDDDKIKKNFFGTWWGL
jgi:hypothetical protein